MYGFDVNTVSVMEGTTANPMRGPFDLEGPQLIAVFNDEVHLRLRSCPPEKKFGWRAEQGIPLILIYIIIIITGHFVYL